VIIDFFNEIGKPNLAILQGAEYIRTMMIGEKCNRSRSSK